MRRPSMATTSSSPPGMGTRSPMRGNRPSFANANPPSVVQSPVRDYGLARGGVVFVGDVADALLHQIFHRHDPRRSAVLVEHDRHVRAGPAQVVEHPLGRAAVWYIKRIPHQIGEA